jgi:hypothetical protein
VNELINLSVFNFNNLISIKANIINNDTIYKIKTIEIQCTFVYLFKINKKNQHNNKCCKYLKNNIGIMNSTV